MYQNDYRRIDDMMRKKGVFSNLETGKQLRIRSAPKIRIYRRGNTAGQRDLRTGQAHW